MSSTPVSRMKQSGEEQEQRQHHQSEEQEQQKCQETSKKSSHSSSEASPSIILPKVMPEQNKPPNGREVITPHDHDVKCGRGKGPRCHPGNIFLREIIVQYQASYKATGYHFIKGLIAKGVFDIIGNRDPPGRFIDERHCKVNGEFYWEIISEENAVKKIKQALRDSTKWDNNENADQTSAANIDPEILATLRVGLRTAEDGHRLNHIMMQQAKKREMQQRASHSQGGKEQVVTEANVSSPSISNSHTQGNDQDSKAEKTRALSSKRELRTGNSQIMKNNSNVPDPFFSRGPRNECGNNQANQEGPTNHAYGHQDYQDPQQNINSKSIGAYYSPQYHLHHHHHYHNGTVIINALNSQYPPTIGTLANGSFSQDQTLDPTSERGKDEAGYILHGMKHPGLADERVTKHDEVLNSRISASLGSLSQAYYGYKDQSQKIAMVQTNMGQDFPADLNGATSNKRVKQLDTSSRAKTTTAVRPLLPPRGLVSQLQQQSDHSNSATISKRVSLSHQDKSNAETEGVEHQFLQFIEDMQYKATSNPMSPKDPGSNNVTRKQDSIAQDVSFEKASAKAINQKGKSPSPLKNESVRRVSQIGHTITNQLLGKRMHGASQTVQYSNLSDERVRRVSQINHQSTQQYPSNPFSTNPNIRRVSQTVNGPIPDEVPHEADQSNLSNHLYNERVRRVSQPGHENGLHGASQTIQDNGISDGRLRRVSQTDAYHSTESFEGGTNQSKMGKEPLISTKELTNLNGEEESKTTPTKRNLSPSKDNSNLSLLPSTEEGNDNGDIDQRILFYLSTMKKSSGK